MKLRWKTLCKNGHIVQQLGPEGFVCKASGLEPPVVSRPMCPVCYVEWHDEMFGAERVDDDARTEGS